METMVNLRRALTAVDPKYKSYLHLFAAPIDMVIDIKTPQKEDEEKYMWEQARSYKKALSQAMAQGQWKRQVTAFSSFNRFNGAIYKVLGGLAKKQGRVKAAAISNLGVLDTTLKQTQTQTQTGENMAAEPVNRGPFRLARLQWGITEHGIGQWVFVAASTQKGVLNLTLTMPSPMVSEARARGMLEGIVGRLTV
jgi:hypothetical protein